MSVLSNSQKQQQQQQQSLYKGQIEASNQFYIANIEKIASNYPSMHISQNDLEKRERKVEFMKKVQNQKDHLKSMLKENTDLYKQHKKMDFYDKRTQQSFQLISCYKELIGEIDQLDSKQKLIIQKGEDLSESLQYIDNINKITIEHQNLQGFLNQVQLENEKSIYNLTKEKN